MEIDRLTAAHLSSQSLYLDVRMDIVHIQKKVWVEDSVYTKEKWLDFRFSLHKQWQLFLCYVESILYKLISQAESPSLYVAA